MHKDDLSPRLSKTCDDCKGRKVKCISKAFFPPCAVLWYQSPDFLVTVAPGEASCRGCLRRKVTCKFSHTRRLLRKPENDNRPAGPRLASSVSIPVRPLENASPVTDTTVRGKRFVLVLLLRWLTLSVEGVEPEELSTPSCSSPCPPEPELYIDRLLEHPGVGGINLHDDCIYKVRQVS
jgi:hypothetical protein